MGKDKLRKFRENLTFDCFIQPEFDEVFRCDHPLKGHWRSDFFHNDNPIVLELGCGKGEYTVALAATISMRMISFIARMPIICMAIFQFVKKQN